MSFVDLHFAFIARRRDPSLAVEANQNVGVEEEHSEPDAAAALQFLAAAGPPFIGSSINLQGS